MMVRIMPVIAVALVAGACSWPPRPAAPPVAPNAAPVAAEEAETLPQARVPERPAIPRVSPPVVPGLGGGRGGLL